MTLYAQILSNRQFLSISGQDVPPFFQGLITNDINKATDNMLIYTALLSPKGRYVHDFFIRKQEKEYLIDVHKERREDLLKRLSLYKLRSNIEVKKVQDTHSVMAIWGESSFMEEGGVYQDPRVEALGGRIYGSRKELENLKSKYEEGDYTYHRIKLGVPEAKSGLIEEKTIPLEANLDYLNAISFKKGCYMGQELTARTYHQGLIRKRILPFQLSEDISAHPNTIISDKEKELGIIVTRYKDLGLARIRLENLKNESKDCPVYVPKWIPLQHKDL